MPLAAPPALAGDGEYEGSSSVRKDGSDETDIWVQLFPRRVLTLSTNEVTMATKMWHELGAAAFEPSAIDDWTRQVNDLIEQTLAAFPALHTRTDVPEIRRVSARKGRARSRRCRSRQRDGPARFPVAEAASSCASSRTRIRAACYLHIHGGGWTLGAAHQQDPLLECCATRPA